MELTHFNDLPEAEAIEVVSVWARVPAWAEAVAGTRPFASVDELEATADRLARSWGRPELDAALAHLLAMLPLNKQVLPRFIYLSLIRF